MGEKMKKIKKKQVVVVVVVVEEQVRDTSMNNIKHVVMLFLSLLAVQGGFCCDRFPKQPKSCLQASP